MREKTRRGRLNEYGNEYGKYAACVLSGFVLYGLSEAVGEIGDPVRDGVLARNEYGGGDRQYELLVEGLENGEEQVKVTVPERKMSDAEVQKELPGIMEYLKGEILGGNSSLSKVQSDLNLTRTLVKYGLSVEWESGDPETVSDMGLIGSEMPESGKTVTLRAGLTNGYLGGDSCDGVSRDRDVGRNIFRVFGEACGERSGDRTGGASRNF